MINNDRKSKRFILATSAILLFIGLIIAVSVSYYQTGPDSGAADKTTAIQNNSPQKVLGSQRGKTAIPDLPAFEFNQMGEAELIDARVTSVSHDHGKTAFLRSSLVKTTFKSPFIRVDETFVENEDGEVERERMEAYIANELMVSSPQDKVDTELVAREFDSDSVVQIVPGVALVNLGEATLDTVNDAIAAHQDVEGIQFIEPNYLHFLSDVTPNDSLFGRLWGLNNSANADVDAPQAWMNQTGSKDVKVGIIDTGVDINHQDLAANIWTNPGESGLDASGNDKATNGIDDDNNGFVDDVHGWDFGNDDNDPRDTNGHGTHCAGTVGAVGNNGRGVSGVCWNVSIVPLKGFGDGASGASSSDLARCVAYASQMNVQITNNSYGSPRGTNIAAQVITRATNEGMLFVAASGNSGLDADRFPHFPSGYNIDGIVSVASTTASGNLSGFSNYGRVSVDVGAPGSSILSTFPGNNYRFLSGTSMASPHVAGAAALLLSESPNLTNLELKELLMNTGKRFRSLSGRVASNAAISVGNAMEQIGDGRLAANFLRPTNGATLPSDKVTFEWSEGRSVSSVRLKLGSAAGGSDIFDSGALVDVTSVEVTELPQDGRSVYATLESTFTEGEPISRSANYEAYEPFIEPEPSELTSPVAGGVLDANQDLTIRFTEGVRIVRNWLFVGRAPGSSHFFSGAITNGQTLSLNLYEPEVYFRLWSLREDNRWVYNDYRFDTDFVTPVASELTSPSAGDTVENGQVTFRFDQGTNIRRNWLYVGSSQGGADLYNSAIAAGTFEATANIQSENEFVYVRVWSLTVTNRWIYNDYRFDSDFVPVPSVLLSPTAGTTVESGQIAFRFDQGKGVSRNWLYVGSSQGAADLHNAAVPSGTYEVNVNLEISIETIHVRLWSLTSDQRWNFNDYSFSTNYVKPVASVLLSPSIEDSLSNGQVTFRFDQGTSITANWLWVGSSKGSTDLYNSRLADGSTEVTVDLQPSSEFVHVRLWSFTVDRFWRFNDYVFPTE